MDFKTIEKLKQEGFSGFKTVKELTENNKLIPTENGVYLILNENNLIPIFLKNGTGGFFKGKNPNVVSDILKRKWVDETNTVYIGKATSLRKRLNQYFRFGIGKNVGHYGGRYIWQLENSKDLIVCWKIADQDPRELEKELINLFFSKYKKLPFANLVN